MNMNLLNILTYRAQHQSNKQAYIFLKDGETESVSLTYGQLNKQASLIASYLQHRQGERALLLYPPGLEFITAFLGCLYAGIIAVPVYPPRRNQKLYRLLSIANDAQATVALTTTLIQSDIEKRWSEEPDLAQLKFIATDTIESNLKEFVFSEVKPDNLAFLQYTSGSTGTPKGVMITHGNLQHNLSLIYKCFEHTANSKGVIWLPPYHDMGLIGGVLQPIYGGFPVVLMPAIAFLQKPIRWLKVISRYRATTSGGPNFAYDLCVNKIKPEQLESLDLSSWEVAFTVSEPVRAQTLERFAHTFANCGFRSTAFYPCYGMAETTLIVSGGLKAQAPVVRCVKESELLENRIVLTSESKVDSRKIVGCGRSCLDQKIAIAKHCCKQNVNPETLIECSDRQVGEIWVKGESVAGGYWKKPELTQQTFHGYLSNTGEGPFLRTGDLGFLQDGELFVTGRIKDVMIFRGLNHYPQDIELTVQNSHQVLRTDCGASFSVEVKGEERLVIVQEVERSSYLRKLDIIELIGNISEAVSRHHGLQIFAVVLVKTGSIPKTSSGKIQRYACKDSFLKGSLDVVEDWSENPCQKIKVRHLQSDVESLLEKVQASK